jgi:hypothetical protein
VNDSVVDPDPTKWAFAGQLYGPCKSGGGIWMAFSEKDEFVIRWKSNDDKNREAIHAKSKRPIYRFLMDCKAKRP